MLKWAIILAIVAIIAGDDVISGPTRDLISARASHQHIGAVLAPQLVGAVAAGKAVGALAAYELFVRGPASDRIPKRGADHDLDIQEFIVTLAGGEIQRHGRVEFVVRDIETRAAIDRISSAVGSDTVVAVAAKD